MIIVDGNNACHIAFHTTGDLSWEDMKTGVVFGFMRRVLTLAVKFQTSDIVFCWDSKKCLREAVLFRHYKSARKKKYKEMSATEIEARKLLHLQIEQLRTEILPTLGFVNNFMETGFEADDLIAKIAEYNNFKNRMSEDPFPTTFIVSTDKDLYQLINDTTLIYNPITKKIIDAETVKEKYEVDVENWVEYRALSGDKSDSIDGIPSVGVKSAVVYLRGEPSYNIRKRIENKEAMIIKDRNMKLMKLPFTYKGRPKRPRIGVNEFDRRNFIEVFDRLRFMSFLKEDNFIKWEKAFKL